MLMTTSIIIEKINLIIIIIAVVAVVIIFVVVTSFIRITIMTMIRKAGEQDYDGYTNGYSV